MRRLAALVVALTMLPATAAVATELDELLAQSQETSYSAEQIISCSTPEGVRDTVVRITHRGGELTVSSGLAGDVEIAAGDGTWSLRRGGGLVAEATVDEGKGKSEPLYSVEEEEAVDYLGRAAMSYLLIREGSPRAELVFDDETGVLVSVVTLTIDGDVYCERRFVSFDLDVGEPVDETDDDPHEVAPSVLTESHLPDAVAGFERLDQYEDEDGVRFAYYSDGFFSFALFETPRTIALPDATSVSFAAGDYNRVFTAGQVTYVWETPSGGAALVGDLPPDLHEAVLAEMPRPYDPGFFRRWWRSLFG